MHRYDFSRRHRLTAALVAALALSLSTVVQQSGVAGAADSPASPAPVAASAVTTSPISLVAPGQAVGNVYDDRVFINLGLYVRANNEPFELWSGRASYADPIQTEWRSDSRGTVPLPEVMTSFRGLKEFLRVKIKDGTGKTVFDSKRTICLTGGKSTSPDAPTESAYPLWCPVHPYTVGSVMGIQKDWAAAPLSFLPIKGFKAANGPFRVVASITQPYVDLFGIEPADARRSYSLAFPPSGKLTVAGQESVENSPAAEPTVDSAGAPAGPSVDLRSLPAYSIKLGPKGDLLRFAATTWNAGDSPLVIDGYRDEGEDDMTAYQLFFDADGVKTGHQVVGQLHFHGANHQHWHFEDFARYRLLKPDMTLATPSLKRSWCLANTDQVDLRVPGAVWQPYNTDLASACGGSSALSIREVLLSGSGDTYHQFRAGQAFDVSKLPNGRYLLSVEANPFGNLIESDTANNDSLRTIWLWGKGANRRVVVAPVGSITR